MKLNTLTVVFAVAMYIVVSATEHIHQQHALKFHHRRKNVFDASRPITNARMFAALNSTYQDRSVVFTPDNIIRNQTDGYDEQLSRKLLYMSSISYCDLDRIQSWTCNWCTQYFPDFKVTAAALNATGQIQGITGYSVADNKIYVAYRGTNGMVNWWENLDLKQVDYPACTGCKVHEGFLQSHFMIWDQMLQGVKDAVAALPKGEIWLTGHSLGSALAGLSAVDFVAAGISIRGLYSYGLPRMGNQAYASWWRDRFPTHYRVVHANDVVVHVPPQMFGYFHTNQEIFYNEAMTSFVQCDGSGEDPNCSDSVPFINYSINDHTHYFGIEVGDSCQ